MLSDADIERWSRQILLPEVGGRGQERLLAARVMLAGHGPLAEHSADLLRRAGVPLLGGSAAGDAALFLDLSAGEPAGAVLARRALAAGAPLVRGRLAGVAGSVRTLVGRPCGLCVADDPDGSAPGALAAPATLALAGLVAAEVLAALLTTPRQGRVQRFDLAHGDFGAAALDGPGCDACGARA